VFHAEQSGHCPAHLTLWAPHSLHSYAVFALAICNHLIYLMLFVI
jgi:hypothetical protein